MSRCSYQKHAIDYAEGKLDLELKSEFELHLTQCHDCQVLYKEVVSLYNLLKQDQIIEPNTETWNYLRRSIREEARIKPRPWLRWLKLSPLLIPAMAAGLLFIVMHHRSSGVIEYPVPVENIIQNHDLDLISLDNLVDDSLYQQLISLETYFEPAVNDAIEQLSNDEKESLINMVEEQYGRRT